MFAPLKSAFRRLKLSRIMPTIEDQETAYLNGAVSIHDLERREREIAQGRFSARSIGW